MLIKRNFFKFWFVCTLLPLVLLIVGSTSASNTQISSSNSVAKYETEWLEYTDPQFDFSVQYPKNWKLLPRNDLGGLGGNLAFINDKYTTTNDPHDSMPKVVIGMYLIPWSERLSLSDKTLKGWTDTYNELSQGLIVGQIDVSQNTKVDNRDALFEEGKGIVNFRYFNIPKGDIVWFIWSNSKNEEDINTFEIMVNSFRFGEGTPDTLQQVYGNNFQPLSFNKHSISKQDNQFGNGKSANRPRLLSSSWRVPLNGGVWTATCSSAAHNNNRSRYAIDVGRPVGTSVYASNSGNIVFAGWDTSGYGNLVKMTTGSYTHYYAHLSSFDYNTILSYPYWYAYNSQRIGYVGNTGNSSGTHLHFEIRNSANNGVSLIGMSGFTATNYPYPGNPCGTVSY